MHKWLNWTKAIIYTVMGILVIIFHIEFINFLSYLVGGMLIFISIENLVVDIKDKKFMVFDSDLSIHLTYLLSGILLMTVLKNNFLSICVIWGILTILKGFVAISRGIAFYYQEKWTSIIKFISAIISIAFAIVLVINPEGHVTLHIVILGAEFIFEAIKLIVETVPKLNKMSVEFENHEEQEIKEIEEKIKKRVEKIEERKHEIENKIDEIIKTK